MMKWITVLFFYLSANLCLGQNNSLNIEFERALKGEPPNVTYVHQEEATVVLNIWVDAEGRITKTEVNAAQTSSLDYNLLNWCRKFVYRLKFEVSPDKKYRPIKKGIVTLYFKP